MKGQPDTRERKLARSTSGGQGQRKRRTLDETWDEVQAANRAAGPWGTARIENGEAHGPHR